MAKPISDDSRRAAEFLRKHSVLDKKLEGTCERREEAERPAKEAAERENARRRALHLAADDMLAVLTSIDGRYRTGDVIMGDDLYRYMRDTIAKAEGRAS